MTSYYTLPLLFFNLGGEMIYILDQRLRAQNIHIAKANRVLEEMSRVMLDRKLIEDLFAGKLGCLREVLTEIANCSIMRLSHTSMSKLYDLMVTVFKYQLYSAIDPRETLLITLNHLDGIRNVVPSPPVHSLIDHAYFLIIKRYGQINEADLQRIRYSLLNKLQDVRVRVSLLLRQGLQAHDGSFVIPTSGITLYYGCEVPGKIKIFPRGEDGHGSVVTFKSGLDCDSMQTPPSTDLRGPRNTLLGTNVYFKETREGGIEENNEGEKENQQSQNETSELDLLVTLLGPPAEVMDQLPTLHIFQQSPNHSARGEDEEMAVKSTDDGEEDETTSYHSQTLSQILSEMPQLSKDDSQFDLATLMDDLA